MLEAKDASKRTLENLIGPELILMVNDAINLATRGILFTTTILLPEKSEAAVPLLIEYFLVHGYKVTASETNPTLLIIAWHPRY